MEKISTFILICCIVEFPTTYDKLSGSVISRVKGFNRAKLVCFSFYWYSLLWDIFLLILDALRAKGLEYESEKIGSTNLICHLHFSLLTEKKFLILVEKLSHFV